MRRSAGRTGIAGLVLLLSLAACSPENGHDAPDAPDDGDAAADPADSADPAGDPAAGVVEGTGTVVWRTVEGGLYVIEADDGTTYEPLNLPSEFRVDSLGVSFEGEVRSDAASIHMVGPLLDITAVQQLEDPT